MFNYFYPHVIALFIIVGLIFLICSIYAEIRTVDWDYFVKHIFQESFMILAIIAVIFLSYICFWVFNDIYIVLTNEEYVITDYNTSKSVYLEKNPLYPNNYITFNETEYTYTYYTKNINTNEIQENTIPIKYCVIIYTQSDETPRLIHAENNFEYYMENNTNKLVKKKEFTGENSYSQVYIFLIPQNSMANSG